MKNKIVISFFVCALVFSLGFLFFLKGVENRGAKFESDKDGGDEASIPKDLGSHRSVTRESGSKRKISDEENVEFRPVTALSLLEFSEIGLKNIADIKKSLGSGTGWVISNSPENAEPHETLTKAFERMHNNVSMASIPTKFCEDDEFFYFSGGNTAHEILDFSSGIAVSKKDGSMASWEMPPVE